MEPVGTRMAEPTTRPATVAVETALNSRVSSGIGGPHHGRWLAGEVLDRGTVRWVAWAGHQVHGLSPELRLRTYLTTPTGILEYDPDADALSESTEALSEVFIPTAAEGGVSVLHTLEGLAPGKTGESPHFDGLWKVGNAYQAIALWCAGLLPRPLACANWSATKWQPSGWPRVRILSRPRELAFQTIRVTAMAPSWPGDASYAPGLHPKWQTSSPGDDPRTGGEVALGDAMADFAWTEAFAPEPLAPRIRHQLLWGTCGTTCHDILGGQWGRFLRMTRAYGTPYPAAGGHYYIRTQDTSALAYLVDGEGVHRYVSISPQGAPTSAFTCLLDDREAIHRLEQALDLPAGFCPQYAVLNDYRGDWVELETASHRWFDVAEAGSMEYCLRLQAHALGLGVKTFLQNGAKKRAALVRACPFLAHPMAVIAVGHPASGAGQEGERAERA